MAERGVLVLGLLLASIFQTIATDSLTPLIGWSNSDILRSVKVVDNVDVNAVVERLHLDGTEVVVVFRTAELNFDEIVKFGGAFGGSNTMFGSVEKSIDGSVSALWSGVTGDFVHALSLRMGTSAQVFSGKYGQAVPTTSKLLLVELDGFGDSTVGNVMSELDSKKTSYVAFYTSKEPSSSRRSRAATADAGSSGSNCIQGYGKVFTDGSGTPCMLFCLTKPMILTVELIANTTTVNTTVNVNASTSSTFYNYNNSAVNTTTVPVPPTINQCNVTGSSTSIPASAASIGFGVQTNNSNVSGLNIAFVFPINDTSSSPYQYFWTMVACVSGTYAGRSQFYAVMSRAKSDSNPDNELYVPLTNSYACSSAQYETYVPSSAAVDPKLNISSLWSTCGFPPNAASNNSIYVSGGDNLTFVLNITGIQVQPYIVRQTTLPPSNSFDTPYNCEGYFSIPILMGIFSVAILLIILYLGNVFMFSIKTLDRFDDPRAPTITVDRLH